MTTVTIARPAEQKVAKITVTDTDLAALAGSANYLAIAGVFEDARLANIERVALHKTADFIYSGGEELYLAVGLDETALGAQPDALSWPWLMTDAVADVWHGIDALAGYPGRRIITGIIENALTPAGPAFAQFGGARGPGEQAVYVEYESIVTRMRAALLSDTALTSVSEAVDLEWGTFDGDVPAAPGGFAKLEKYRGLATAGWSDTLKLTFDDTHHGTNPKLSTACFLYVPVDERMGCRASLTGTPLEEDAEIVVEAEVWPLVGQSRRLQLGPVPYYPDELGSELRLYAWTKDGAANLSTLTAGSVDILIYYRDHTP
jgi:hypothetical protein